MISLFSLSAADWTQLVALALELVGVALVLTEMYRADVRDTVETWLAVLPDRLQAMRPRDSAYWLPFWFLFGPIAAYFLYLPITADNAGVKASLLVASLVLFALSDRWRRSRWWQVQPISYLLLAPFALPNMMFVWAVMFINWLLRRLLGNHPGQRLFRVGAMLAAAGLLLDVFQTLVLFAE